MRHHFLELLCRVRCLQLYAVRRIWHHKKGLFLQHAQDGQDALSLEQHGHNMPKIARFDYLLEPHCDGSREINGAAVDWVAMLHS